MTYIKWKDEVESYLVNMPQDEKNKIFSYFSEMYADKRDAGKSEAQIIEEFGAPYDVAKRILDGNKESADTAETNEAPAKVNGGSNYNYNYYNYNYGGAPQTPPQAPPQTPPPAAAQQPAYQQSATQQQSAPFQNGVPNAYIQGAKPAEKSAGKTAFDIIVIIVLIALTAGLAGAAASGMCQGWVEIGAALGAAVAGRCSAGEAIAEVGLGLLNVGGSTMLLAGVSALAMAARKKIKAVKGDKR